MVVYMTLNDTNSTATDSGEDDLSQIVDIIGTNSPEAQVRIHLIAKILRDLLQRDETDETLLAFTLVMAEVARR